MDKPSLPIAVLQALFENNHQKDSVFQFFRLFFCYLFLTALPAFVYIIIIFLHHAFNFESNN
jgi:hypothetical protein